MKSKYLAIALAVVLATGGVTAVWATARARTA